MADTNFFLIQGDSFSKDITYASQGSPTTVDLTGCTISGDIRKEFTTDVVASFDVTNTDLSTGQFNIALSAAVTAALPMNVKNKNTVFVYDVQISWPTSPVTVDTILSGYFKVQQQVTS